MAIEKPLVSVIIPVYNTQIYLEACLQSALSQSLKQTEFICINDGSTDNSLKILERYAENDDRVKIINQSNQGLSSARNRGIEQAKGEYLCFLDSDDLLLPDALKKMSEAASFQHLDVLIFEFVLLYETGRMQIGNGEARAWQRQRKYEGVMTGQNMFAQMYCQVDYRCTVWGQCFRRNFLEEIGHCFVEGIVHEDELFSLKALLLANRTAHLYEPLYLYRLREGSIMNSAPSLLQLESYFRILLEEVHICRTWQISENVKSCILSNIKGLLRNMIARYSELPCI